jgi:hypothetical protein
MSDHQDVLWTTACLRLGNGVVNEKKTVLKKFNRLKFDTQTTQWTCTNSNLKRNCTLLGNRKTFSKLQ